MKSNSFKSLFLAALMGSALLSAPLMAADSNVTINNRDYARPVGIKPTNGYLRFTVTSTTTPSADLPAAGSANVEMVNCTVRDTNGNLVPRNISTTANVVTVGTATGQASGTLAVGDTVRCSINYK